MTALAPCILPLLPIILGGSFVGNTKNKWRPYIVIGSLLMSLFIFTLLLKFSTALLGIDPSVWAFISGGIVIILGVFMLFPNWWAQVVGRLGFEHVSQRYLGKANTAHGGTGSAILTGAALGPVFSSCSPTYAWVIATALPTSLATGLLYLLFYLLGLASILLAIALIGRVFVQKLAWASNPSGWFQRVMAILFIVVGLFVATGTDKTVQTYLVEKDFWGIKSIELQIAPQ